MLAVLLLMLPAETPAATASDSPADLPRPNILWISSEDNGPQLGCYGDEYAITPNLDALAARSLRYDKCWSNAPVCAPARTTIITGMYGPSIGSEHMRSLVERPPGIELFPAYLAQAGYYCTNPGKTDYNVNDGPMPRARGDRKAGNASESEDDREPCWVQPQKKSHYRNRADGQPFFHVYNSTISHESKIRVPRPYDQLVHDPDAAPVPPFHPDTPEVRMDWAQYYSRITQMDAEMGKQLADLKTAGLDEDTIVVYWGDHGSGMPRSKRTPFNSGLHVPLIVHIPEKFAHLRPDDYAAGGSTPRLVSFVDFAPTMLSLAGIDPPEHLQGRAFAGQYEAEPKQYLYGFRGRMDSRYDPVRSITDGRYVYVRNFLPSRPHGQFLAYQFETPTTRIWKTMFDAGQTDPVQSQYWSRKAPVELFDLETDPHEVVNLLGPDGSDDVLETAATLRDALAAWQADIHDIGLMPEGAMHHLIQQTGRTAYELARDESVYNIDRVLELATASKPPSGPVPGADAPVAEQYWAVQRGAKLPTGTEPASLLERPSASVRIAAAERLIREGEAIEQAIDTLVACGDPTAGGINPYDVMFAGTTLQVLVDEGFAVGDAAARFAAQSEATNPPGKRPDVNRYINDLRARLLATAPTEADAAAD